MHALRFRNGQLSPIFGLQQHIVLSADVMMLGVTTYDTWLFLMIIDALWQPRGTFGTFLKHMWCRSVQFFQKAFLNKIMLVHTDRVSRECTRHITTLLPIPISHQLCTSEIIWDSSLGNLRVSLYFIPQGITETMKWVT